MVETKWDKWQKDLIEHEGSITARCGRQTGKSYAVSKRRANQMLKYVGSVSLITAPAQRQSEGLFKKVMSWLYLKNKEVLDAASPYVDDYAFSAKKNMELRRKWEYDNGIFNENPTKINVVLKRDFSKPRGSLNEGSICFALPAGRTGTFLRFLTLDFLDIDEAAFVPQVVYDTLRPMLAISAKEKGLGWETLLSTPFGKGGFFYYSHHSDDFRQFHISAESCPRYDKLFLRKEKKRMTKQMYTQEYLAEFIDSFHQFFSTELIKNSMTFIEWSKQKDTQTGRFYLGVDIARYGGDENAFVVAELIKNKVKIVKCFTTERVSTVDTIGRIQTLDREYGFKKIFIDDGGVGGGVTDVLIDRLGRRVLGLNNSSKRFTMDGEDRKRGILKEDLYSNVLMLMETHNVDMISNLDLMRSLKSITFEYSESGRVKINGSYSHLAEALVRACWCVKDKGLDLYIY